MLIDTHVHLNDEQYDDDLSEVITRAREAGVDRMFVGLVSTNRQLNAR
ncbi:TatD family hydrolase [Staphylococcus aureus]